MPGVQFVVKLETWWKGNERIIPVMLRHCRNISENDLFDQLSID